MPDVRMPDGTIIRNVPENMTPEQKAAFAARAKAYVVPGLTEAVSAANTQERQAKEDWLGTREKLASVKEDRYKALEGVDTPEKLVTAYGYRPEDFTPEDMGKLFDLFVANHPSKKAGAAGSFMENMGQTLLGAPATFVRQAAAGLSGDQKRKNFENARAKMYSETSDVRTGDHPIASTAGAMAGGLPMAIAAPEGLMGAGLAGAAMTTLTPNTSDDPLWLASLKKAGIGGAGGYFGGKLMQGANTLGTKAVAGARGVLPEAEAANQRMIMEGLGIPAENITAADILMRNGVRSKSSKITAFRDLAKASGGRLSAIDESNLSQLNNKVGGIQQGAARDLAETPFAAPQGAQLGPLTPGEALQESLPMEQGIRRATITDPAYAAIPPMPPDAAVPHAPFLSGLERRVGELEAKGAGSPYSAPLTAQGESPIKLLQQQLENIKGKPGEASVAPEMVWPPEVQKLITEQGFPEEIFIKQGVKKIPMGGSAGTAGEPGMDTVYGLRQILENLKHNRQKFNTVGGNKLTHPITETINDLQGTLEPALGSPEWQAHLTGKAAADQLHATYVAPYNESLLKGLLRKGGQAGEEVLPSRAMGKAASMNPEELSILSGALEQKGQAGLRSGLLDELVGSSTNPAMPQGLQVDPKMLLGQLKEWPGMAALTPQQGSEIGKLQRALELMDQIGSKQTPLSASMDVATAPASNRSLFKAAAEGAARLSDRMLTSQRGKAILLTPSAASDPALSGTATQAFLKYLEKRMPGQAMQVAAMLGGIENPMKPEE